MTTDTQEGKAVAEFDYHMAPGERAAFANGRASRDDEIASLTRQLAEARASEEAWKIIAKKNDQWNALPQTEKEAALHKALDDTTAELAEARAEAELWHSRCISAIWLISGDVTLGRLQEAAKEAAELRKLHAAAVGTEK